INLKRYTFYRAFIAQTVRWINHVYRLQKREVSIDHLSNQYWVINQNNLNYHIRCDTIRQYIQNELKLKDNDIIVATDSSHDKTTELTGMGIFIKDKDIFHNYAEPLGTVSNNFGELFAICKSDWLIKKLKINTNNRRIIIMTDSLCSFCPLITPPKNIKKQIKFPRLFTQTQRKLKEMKAILWKIKSHTKKINISANYFGGIPRDQPHNSFADKLADKGRLHPNNKQGIPHYMNQI
ncbi:MAG: hypothetical protein GY928_26745, partial [Colwellia sp.]|nr:hypothetical protein [Colwellia sp.]